MGRQVPLAVLLGAWLTWAPPALADQVLLGNGDRLSGEIREMTGGKLILVTPYAGPVTILWEEVAGVVTEGAIEVELRDGDRVIGVLVSPSPGILVVQSPALGEVQVAVERVLGLAPPGYRPKIWSGEGAVGVGGTRGNTDTTTAHLAFAVKRRAPRDRLTLKGLAEFEETEGTETINRSDGEIKLDLFPAPRHFFFGRVAGGHDRFRDLNLRTTVGVGGGYKFIDTARTQLEGEIGPELTREVFTSRTETQVGGRVFLGWTERVFTASEVSLRGTYLPALTDTREFRLVGEADLTTPLTERLSLRLSLRDEFDNDPEPGIEGNDVSLRSSLVVKF